MLSNARIGAVIPVTDLERARSFYEGVLGLQVGQVIQDQMTVIYHQGGTRLTVYQRATASSGEHTITTFSLGADFESAVSSLLNQGVAFDTFEVPGVELDWDANGILHDGPQQTGWFKDPDGNILAIDND
jgi:catechol 2,3-dioxygenase-like lactoylglutathione lyase family enzyme